MSRTLCFFRNRTSAFLFCAISFFCITAFGEVITLTPRADTFVMVPGKANCPGLYADAVEPGHIDHSYTIDQDFGGAGSRAVAASTACSPGYDSHGLFRSLIKFNAASLAGESVSSVTLSLYHTQEMGSSAYSMFNPISQSGYFNVYLLLGDGDNWVQGSGTPHTGAETYVYQNDDGSYENTGTSSNSLDYLLKKLATAGKAPALLNTFYYDAASSAFGTSGYCWADYTTTSSAILDAIERGLSFTLLLTPADDAVSFNFKCAVQNNGGSKTADNPDPNGPQLKINVVPEPTTTLFATAAFGLAGLSVAAPRRRNREKRIQFYMVLRSQ